MEQLAFGIQFTPRQRDAYIHLWRVIGFLFGIDDDINPNRGGYEASKIRMESVFAFAIASDPDPDLTWRLSRHICESVSHGARVDFGLGGTMISAGTVSMPAWLFLGREYGEAVGLPAVTSAEKLQGVARRLVLGAALAAHLLILKALCRAPAALRTFYEDRVQDGLMRAAFAKTVAFVRAGQPNCRFGRVPVGQFQFAAESFANVHAALAAGGKADPSACPFLRAG